MPLFFWNGLFRLFRWSTIRLSVPTGLFWSRQIDRSDPV